MRGSHGWSHVSEERKRDIVDAIAGGRATQGPVHAELDITDRCNVACYFCNQQDVRTKEFLSVECIQRLVAELVTGGLRSVRLSGGGDPLFHPRILEVFEIFNDAGVIVDNLTTNGVALTGAVADALIRGRAREVVVSLNASNSTDYARMMKVRPDRFDIIINNIRALLEKRASSEFPVVVLQFLLDRENFHLLGEMYHGGIQVGADVVSVGVVTKIAGGGGIR